jgi:hypothetical protein
VTKSRSLLVVVGAVLLAACAPAPPQPLQPVIPVTGLDGPPTYRVRCPFEQECLQRAQALCPQGYATLDQAFGTYGASMRVQCAPGGAAPGAPR